MKIRRSIGLSLRALFAHKVRAVLALSAVGAGVAALVVTSAIGAGAREEVRRGVENMGTNLLVVRPAQVKRVAVLGALTKEALFGREEAIGREIRIGVVPFEVIGVLRGKGVLADGSDEDNQILIPIRTALRRVLNTRRLSAVFVSVGDARRM